MQTCLAASHGMRYAYALVLSPRLVECSKIRAFLVCQATSYLVTAWEALANKMDTTMEKLPVEFDDVSIVQAVPAMSDDSVQLTVILDGSNRFQVFLCAHFLSTPSRAIYFLLKHNASR